MNGRFQKIGSFFRKSDSKTIQRWKCSHCKKTISQATGTACFGQNKRRVNEPLRKLLCSNVSQRRSALILGIHMITVARKLRFLASQARARQQPVEFQNVQFDEMETFEHTKLKPLSIALAVESERRKIISISVCEMPAKGLIAAKSRAKYGKRRDHRRKSMLKVLKILKMQSESSLQLKSDENPNYPRWVKEVDRNWVHERVKGQRGCIVGQGELKKIGFDPIFSLNHTCAMIRANVNRLARKTWCTTKKMERLQDHLDLYVEFHNEILTK